MKKFLIIFMFVLCLGTLFGLLSAEASMPAKEGSHEIPSTGDVELDIVLNAAMDYYEFTTKYRPGFAEIEGQEDDGVDVHLYDDMGTHIVTAVRYVIDPKTLKGYDAILFTKIDFSPFASKK